MEDVPFSRRKEVEREMKRRYMSMHFVPRKSEFDFDFPVLGIEDVEYLLGATVTLFPV